MSSQYVPEGPGNSVPRLTYSTPQACAALGVSSVTLWRLEKRGLLRAVPGLRHKLWPVRELERFVAGKEVRAS